MKVRFQILQSGEVVRDAEVWAPTPYSILHEILQANEVDYNPTRFYERGGWVCFRKLNMVYRVMNSRLYGA